MRNVPNIMSLVI